jgi:hypothetical protein
LTPSEPTHLGIENLKNTRNRVLRIILRGLFYAKNCFRHSPEFSKKVCHIAVGQKLREEIDFDDTGCFGPGLYPGSHQMI